MESSHASRRLIPIQSVRGPTDDATNTLRLIFYLVEIERQAEIFGTSLDEALTAAISKRDTISTWRHLQSAVFAAIIVNRILSLDVDARPWLGQSKKEAKKAANDTARRRAKQLRALLLLPDHDDDSVAIFGVRSVRDSLEHIDERIDRALHSPGVRSLSDWYLSDGVFLTSPEDAEGTNTRSGLRGFHPESGLLLFDRTPLDLFALDIEMLKLRRNAREAQTGLGQRLQGRLHFGGGQLRSYTGPRMGNRFTDWRDQRRELIAELGPPPPLDGYVRLWVDVGVPIGTDE